MRLAITGKLAKTLSSTNPIESMIEIVRHTQRNVKRWQDGDMRKRWTAAGMLQAEQQFRRIVGYSDLAKLVTAIERRHLTLESQNTPQRPEVSTDTVTTENAAQLSLPSDHHNPGGIAVKVPRRTGQPQNGPAPDARACSRPTRSANNPVREAEAVTDVETAAHIEDSQQPASPRRRDCRSARMHDWTPLRVS
jgi:hypothetical protein